MLLRGSLLVILGYAEVQNDIHFTASQVETLAAKGHNVDGLTNVLVSCEIFLITILSPNF